MYMKLHNLLNTELTETHSSQYRLPAHNDSALSRRGINWS